MRPLLPPPGQEKKPTFAQCAYTVAAVGFLFADMGAAFFTVKSFMNIKDLSILNQYRETAEWAAGFGGLTCMALDFLCRAWGMEEKASLDYTVTEIKDDGVTITRVGDNAPDMGDAAREAYLEYLARIYRPQTP